MGYFFIGFIVWLLSWVLVIEAERKDEFRGYYFWTMLLIGWWLIPLWFPFILLYRLLVIDAEANQKQGKTK